MDGPTSAATSMACRISRRDGMGGLPMACKTVHEVRVPQTSLLLVISFTFWRVEDVVLRAVLQKACWRWRSKLGVSKTESSVAWSSEPEEERRVSSVQGR
jgi:hypothetical protein